MSHRLLPILTAAVALAAILLACAGQQSAVADHHLPGEADDSIAVAIITGQNNHQWTHDTPALKSILDAAGKFSTDVYIAPQNNDPDKARKWDAFRPDFSKYDVVIINYNGHAWPDEVNASFEKYIAGGGKAYVFHAGNNTFKGWKEFEQMVGLLWRDANYGKGLYLNDAGEAVVTEPGVGPGASHGRKHAYVVQTRDADHPIFKGLPEKWLHNEDELYHGQRGPAENMTVLASAFSDPSTGGTGRHEPIVWTIPYGDGLVLTNVMGHWMGGRGPALECAGFQALLVRSIEFLATGKVTSEVPEDFPTETKTSLRKLAFEPIASAFTPLHDAHADCCGGHHHAGVLARAGE